MTIPFYATPKSIIQDAKLSPNARLLFTELLDKLKLSIQPQNRKNFTNKAGTPFVRMTQKTMSIFLGKSLPTVRKALKELVTAGILIIRRVGLTECNQYFFAEWLKNAVFSTERKGVSLPDGKPLPPNKTKPKNNEFREYPKDYTPPKNQKSTWNYTQREYSKAELEALIEKI